MKLTAKEILAHLKASVNEVDTLAVKEVRSFLKAEITVTDLLSVYARDFTDNVTLNDFLNISADKAVTDSIEFKELVDLLIAKVFSENVVITDVINTNTGKSINDEFSLSDSATLDFKALATDSATLFENVQIDADFSRIFINSTQINDIMSINAGLSINDTGIMTDVLINFLTKPLSDNLAVSDSGLISSQNYVAETYFAEDYVGEVTYF